MNSLQFVYVDSTGRVHLKTLNKMVKGVEKLAQEVIYRIINTEIINEALQYNINVEEELRNLFTSALKVIEEAIKRDQSMDFELPDDERLYSLELISITFNENQAVVKVNVISEAGRNKVFSLTI
jgi:hypothetical protein